jgi:RNA 2',3'-cyclic 3'-phosphodiesterase
VAWRSWRQASGTLDPVDAVPDQFSLPGFDPTPQRQGPQDTLFFALLPPAAALLRIEQRAQALLLQNGLTGKPIPADRKHVTLIVLGGHHGVVLQEAVDAASEVASALKVPGFEVVFDSALSFRGSGAFVLRGAESNAPMDAFHQALTHALTQAGLRARPIHTAHMTLAYDVRRIAEQLIEPVRWIAEDFVLIHSLVGQGVHRHLGRWRLQPRS